VEELLDAAFDSYSPNDHYLYAADALKLRLIRVDVQTGQRQVVADDQKLFNFPSSLGFVPPLTTAGGPRELVVVSNQQQRTPITNDAISTDSFELPFVATKVFLLDGTE
jgi:hypothetical protein